jgi:hypothetical protein
MKNGRFASDLFVTADFNFPAAAVIAGPINSNSLTDICAQNPKA